MDIIKLKEDAFIVNNFLTPQECESVIGYFDAITAAGVLDWNQISFFGSFAMGYWPTDQNLLQFNLQADYFNSVKQKIKNTGEMLFDRELAEVSFHAQKWVEGAFAAFHSDNSDEYGNPNAFHKSKYAAFIYLNDNFEGGLLNFEHHDVTVKPAVGMLAFFKGGYMNEHEVTTVKGGERYTIGSFWDNGDEVYDEETIQKWEEELKETRALQQEQFKEWDDNVKRGVIPQYKGKYDNY
jgi:hypothetical protein